MTLSQKIMKIYLVSILVLSANHIFKNAFHLILEQPLLDNIEGTCSPSYTILLKILWWTDGWMQLFLTDRWTKDFVMDGWMSKLFVMEEAFCAIRMKLFMLDK